MGAAAVSVAAAHMPFDEELAAEGQYAKPSGTQRPGLVALVEENPHPMSLRSQAERDGFTAKRTSTYQAKPTTPLYE